MQCGGGASLVKLPIAADRFIRAQALDGDAAPLELGYHLRIGMQPPVSADAEDQSLRLRVEDLVEVVHR